MSNETDDSSELPDLVEKEITKATISQSVGTLIYPITREIANLEEKGITKIKSFIKNTRKQKLGEENKKEIEDLITETEQKPENLVKIEKIHAAVEIASNRDIENDQLFLLWDSIIKKIAKGEDATDNLVDILKTISPEEAEFIIDFEEYKYKKIIISPLLKSLKYKRHTGNNKLEQIALSLAKKGILDQPFSITPILLNFFLYLVMVLMCGIILSNINTEMYGATHLLANMAFWVIIAITFGVIGAFLSLKRQYPLVLTWVGKRLQDGAISVKKAKNNT